MKRIFTVFAALVAMAQAEIPAVAFKDVTKHFKDKHYSPVMGRWALDSGFIYNLRHFGLFTPTMGKNPDGTERRLYDSDKPQDAMMELLLKLFPSSAGPLASESTGISNFGKRATIQDVADMLRFVKEVRAIIEEDPHPELNSNFGLEDVLNKYSNFGDLRAIIKKAISLEIKSGRKTKKQVYNEALKIQGGWRLKKRGLEADAEEKKFEESEKNRALKHKNTTQLRVHELRGKQVDAQEENRLYPLYTTEQIILAFFVHRFNDKSAIYELMQALGDEFVTSMPYEWVRKHASLGGATNAEIASLINKDLWTLENIASYPNKTDLDYVFFNTYHEISAPIAFANGLSPISNGNCPYIKVTESGKKIDPTRGSFADCHETAIRQLFAIGFYDAKSKTFKIPDGITNPYLRNFFEDQTPIKANDGSSEMRGLWNLVIGGMPWVRYLKESNEIDSGFINLIKAMRHILEVKKDFLPKDKEEVIEELIYLFKAMNPDLKEIDIKISGFSPSKRGVDDEFYGNAVIEITNAYDQGFSFTLHESLGHADIQNPNWEASGISMNPTQISDGILDKRNPKTGLHKLLATQEFADERQRIDRVKDFNQEVKIQHIPIINRMMDLKVRDRANINAATEAILPIIQNEFVFESAFDIANESANDAADETTNDNLWNELFENYKEDLLNNLEKKGYITLNQNRYDKIKSNISKVRKVNIKSDIEKLDLAQANALQEISLAFTENIGTLILPNTPSLKKINLAGNVKNLLNLNLSKAIALEEFKLCKSLIGTLIMPNSRSLKVIDLCNIRAGKLDLTQAKALEFFTLTASSAHTIIFPIPSASLKKVSLSGNITTVDLSHAKNLEELSVYGKVIETLILPISKKELGDDLDQNEIDKIVYVNPDGSAVGDDAPAAGDGAAIGGAVA